MESTVARAPAKKRSKRDAVWIGAYIAVLCAAGAIFGNPLELIWESGPSAYYQARVAYGRSPEGRAAIAEAFEDRKITMREYSDLVFPAYLKGVSAPEPAFPDRERAKSMEQLKTELATAILLTGR